MPAAALILVRHASYHSRAGDRMEKSEWEVREKQIAAELQKIALEIDPIDWELSEVNSKIQVNIDAYRSEFAWVLPAERREFLCAAMAKRRDLRTKRRQLRERIQKLKEESRNQPD